MNLEGTKHEKALLVILSYVVGFTSSFIAFGIIDQPEPQFAEVVDMRYLDDTTAPAIAPDVTPSDATPENDSTDTSLEDTSAPITGTGTEVSYTNGRLNVSVNGQVSLLSVAKSKLTSAVAEAFSTQGTHVALPMYAASPDGNYVYFCEQQQETDSCVNFVFDVKNQIIQYVAQNGSKVLTPTATAKTAIWNQNSLSIGTYHSVNPTEPWIVTVQ